MSPNAAFLRGLNRLTKQIDYKIKKCNIFGYIDCDAQYINVYPDYFFFVLSFVKKPIRLKHGKYIYCMQSSIKNNPYITENMLTLITM